MATEAVSAPVRATDCQGRLATTIDVHIGIRMRQLRLLRGLSQERVAEAVGITFQQVQKYESGTNRISASRLFALAQYLGVSLDYFFDGVARRHAAMRPEGEDAEISRLLATREGLALVRTFASLGDSRVRRAVLRFLTALATQDEA